MAEKKEIAAKKTADTTGASPSEANKPTSNSDYLPKPNSGQAIKPKKTSAKNEKLPVKRQESINQKELHDLEKKINANTSTTLINKPKEAKNKRLKGSQSAAFLQEQNEKAQKE